MAESSIKQRQSETGRGGSPLNGNRGVAPTEVPHSVPPPRRTSGERYRLSDLVVDVGAGVVKRGDDLLSLPRRSFELLVALIRRAPEIARRQELLETVWPNEFVNDDTLSQRVWLLREALNDLEDKPRYLASVRGWGYKVVASVERDYQDPQPIVALAVLPLANLTGDSQYEYFADGMTETLISYLARIRRLKVISRTSVMHYKHTEKRLPEIARELGVEGVVEGSVIVGCGRVRVSVQLIRAETDQHLWADVYDRDIGDVLTLHGHLASSIADQIRAFITPEERRRLEGPGRVNAAACDSDLRARYLLARMSRPDLERAVAQFEEAIHYDPSFARAYAGLAIACFARAVPVGSDLCVSEQRQLLERAEQAAKQALRIDDSVAEAHACLGITLLFRDWDWPGAKQELDTSLELDDNSSFGHLFRGVLASTTLDRTRTLAEMRRATELDPINLLCLAEAAECSFWVRDYAQALAYAARAFQLDSGYQRAHFVVGRVREAEGRIAEAITEYSLAGIIGNAAQDAQRAFERGGAPGYHRWALSAEMAAASSQPGNSFRRAFVVARSHARLGEVDAALQSLEQAYGERECLLVLLRAQEWWDPLRSESRFIDLVRQVGIP